MKKQQECRILAEVIVPCMDQAYDFWLDGRTPFGELAVEMADVICHKEQGRWPLACRSRQGPVLCSLQEKKLLPAFQCPWEYGLKSGVSLLLLL